MDKIKLLGRLAQARERAEKAHLQVVLLTLEVSELKGIGANSAAAEIQLRTTANEEQMRLREMEWILDQLDRIGF